MMSTAPMVIGSTGESRLNLIRLGADVEHRQVLVNRTHRVTNRAREAGLADRGLY